MTKSLKSSACLIMMTKAHIIVSASEDLNLPRWIPDLGAMGRWFNNDHIWWQQLPNDGDDDNDDDDTDQWQWNWQRERIRHRSGSRRSFSSNSPGRLISISIIVFGIIFFAVIIIIVPHLPGDTMRNSLLAAYNCIPWPGFNEEWGLNMWEYDGICALSYKT